MTLMSLLIALVAERLFPQWESLRRFDWLEPYSHWLGTEIHLQRLGDWALLLGLILPLYVLYTLLDNLFANALWGLFDLAFTVLILLYSLGPGDLYRQADDYIEAVEHNDGEQQQKNYQAVREGAVAAEGQSNEQHFLSLLSLRAHQRVYGVILFFAVFGPFAALCYRLLYELQKLRVDELDIDASFVQLLKDLLGWLEWLPVRLSLLGYMLAGHYDASLAGYRRAVNEAVDLDEEKRLILEYSALGAIQAQSLQHGDSALPTLKAMRGLLLRAAVVWLGMAWLISLVL